MDDIIKYVSYLLETYDEIETHLDAIKTLKDNNDFPPILHLHVGNQLNLSIPQSTYMPHLEQYAQSLESRKTEIRSILSRVRTTDE